MRHNATQRVAAHPASVQWQASTPAPRAAGCQTRLGLLIAIPLILALVAWLLWSQVQIGRVLLFGVPARGTVVAANQCSRATGGAVTIVFNDAHGAVRRITHSSYTPGCFMTYQVGEAVAVRYVPGDPATLMTQSEINDLWVSLLIFGLCDVLFIGGGTATIFLVILPRATCRVTTP